MAEEKDQEKTERAEKPIFAWKSPDHLMHPRSSLWYAGVAMISGLIAWLLYRQTNYTGAVLVIIGAILIIIENKMKPKEIECTIYNDGIVVNEKVYQFTDIKSFWLSIGEIPKLVFKIEGRLANIAIMPAMDVDLTSVREYIGKIVHQEEEKGEDMSDVINRLLRF